MDFFMFLIVVLLVLFFWPILKGLALLWVLALVVYFLFFRTRNPRL